MKTQNEISAEFMLREYKMLYQHRSDLLQVQEARINVYFTAISGGLAGLGIVIALLTPETIAIWGEEYPYLLGFISLLIFGCLFWIGVITFVRTVERGIEVIIATRAINRIRRFFVDYDASIRDFLLYPILDNQPSFDALGTLNKAKGVGLPQIVVILNSLIFGLTGATLTRFSILPSTIAVVILGMALFLAAFLQQWRYYRDRVAWANEQFDLNAKFISEPIFEQAPSMVQEAADVFGQDDESQPIDDALENVSS
jgi:hypothetical protein